MAERRMFSKTIIDSDIFLDMPLTTQALYFHLSMRADDEGFINNPKRIQRTVGASDDDLKLLIAKRYLIPFDTGVVVIRHWKVHNYIQNDRMKDTQCIEEKSQLKVENGVYTMDTDCIHDGYSLDTQDRLGKDRLGKDRLGKDNMAASAKPVRHKYGEYQNVFLTEEEYNKLLDEFPDDYQERIDRLSGYIASTGKTYKNHLATIRNWARKDKEQEKPKAQQRPIKTGTAEELDNFYSMGRAWAEGHKNDA